MSAIVCLATYNGARWLQEQIDSVIAQTDEDWQLWFSDDGSSDATLEIIADNVNCDSRLRLLPRRHGEPGAEANFEYLLNEAYKAPVDFIALCDQDDLWHPGKLSQQRKQLQSFSACCSDLMLTDSHAVPTGVRLLQQLRAPAQPRIDSLLAQNSVVGCTLAVRPEVLDLALPFPVGLRNHDWWLALCAMSLGQLFCDSKTLVNYRQHDSNVVGAYNPVRQLGTAPRLLARQRAVLRAQLVAVKALQDRLMEKQLSLPRELESYLMRVGSDSLRERFSALTKGEFAAPHKPLRALRMAAALQKLT